MFLQSDPWGGIPKGLILAEKGSQKNIFLPGFPAQPRQSCSERAGGLKRFVLVKSKRSPWHWRRPNSVSASDFVSPCSAAGTMWVCLPGLLKDSVSSLFLYGSEVSLFLKAWLHSVSFSRDLLEQPPALTPSLLPCVTTCDLRPRPPRRHNRHLAALCKTHPQRLPLLPRGCIFILASFCH